MKYSDLTETERELLRALKEAEERGPADLLMIIAIAEAIAEKASPFCVDQYSRGDFKRAVRLLREAQVIAPRYAESYERAIAHIRADWLHREAM